MPKVQALLPFMTPASFSERMADLAEFWDDWHKGDPHLSFSWLRLLADTAMPAGTRVAVVDCHAEPSEPPCCLALMIVPSEPREVVSLANFYTPIFGFIGAGRADDQRLLSVAKSLRDRQLAFHELRFWPMATATADFDSLERALRNAGWWVGRYFCFGNWFHRVGPGGYAAYLASRPSRLKNTLRRAEKRLQRMEGAVLAIMHGGEPELDTAIKHFVAVYERSWKESEPYPDFIPELCRWAAIGGGLRLGLISIRDRPVAAQLWLVAGSCAYIVKLAYDPDFTQLSVGTLLTAALMREVIDVDHVKKIDYLIGDDVYKKDWMSQRCERWGIVANNPSYPRGMFLALRHWLGRRFKKQSC